MRAASSLVVRVVPSCARSVVSFAAPMVVAMLFCALAFYQNEKPKEEVTEGVKTFKEILAEEPCDMKKARGGRQGLLRPGCRGASCGVSAYRSCLGATQARSFMTPFSRVMFLLL